MTWWRTLVLTMAAGLGCGEPTCKASLAEVHVLVTSQETGAPVEGATVELDGDACTEDGAGSYTCQTGEGPHDLLVSAGIEYAIQAKKFEVPPYACETDPIELEVSLLPSMA